MYCHEVDGDSYCLIRAMHTSLFLQDVSTWSFEQLLNSACDELLKFPMTYMLQTGYEEEIAQFRHNANYMSNTMDMMPKALANITKYRLVIMQINTQGDILEIEINPDFPFPDGTVYLAYHAYRHHYDVAIGEYIILFGEVTNMVLVRKNRFKWAWNCPTCFLLM